MAFSAGITSFLDEDLATSESPKKFLRTCLDDSRKIIPAGCIFQLQHVLNISVPKEDRELPQSYHPGADILKLVLSDGDSNVCAILDNSPPELSMKTPPGTKIRINKPISISHGIFCLSTGVYEVLDGRVPKLVEKWTLQRKLNVKQEWGYNIVGAEEGPPLWKPFGYNATSGIDVAALRNMKAMDIVNELRQGTKSGQDKKTEFDMQRDQALEGIKDKSSKKNWCPPAKTLMDKELADLLKEGFLLEEAEEALKKYRNPRKALQHLKGAKFPQEAKSQAKEKTKWRNVKGDEEDFDPVPREYQRPMTNPSLFGFIEERIKPGTAPLKHSDQDADNDYQLAVQMSIDSFKRESEFRYEEHDEFPSFDSQFSKGKTQNVRPQSSNKFSKNSSNYSTEKSGNEKRSHIKRDFPSMHKQYDASKNQNDEKEKRTWQARDGGQYRNTNSKYNLLASSTNQDSHQSLYSLSEMSLSESHPQSCQIQKSRDDYNSSNYSQQARASTRHYSNDKKKDQQEYQGKM